MFAGVLGVSFRLLLWPKIAICIAGVRGASAGWILALHHCGKSSESNIFLRWLSGEIISR